jgi:acyl transferase domain-containing protein/3-hydroxyacyl-CoA dehydrogenase/phosphopantetheinyl transferase
MRDSDIAVVGMACVFPGASDLDRYWANNVDGVDSVVDPPADRFNGQLNFLLPGRCMASWPKTRGGFIPSDYRFDAMRYGVLPNAVRHGDPDQFLALATIDSALVDAGIPEDSPLRARCDVIVGRGGYPTNKSSEGVVYVEFLSHLMPYLRRELSDWSEERFDRFFDRMRDSLNANDLGSVECIVTSIPNLVASRAANRLDLHGAAYTVDGACASSLLAVEHAVSRLRAGSCDAAVACGLQMFQRPDFWFVFSKLESLSRSNVMRPFDRRADGLLIGEGAGAVVLKRVADARRDGDRVWAVVRGTGSSSDGQGTALLTPNPRGQVEAIRRAWDDAGADPATIGYLEAHGTAMPIGDPAEVESIRRVWGGGRGLPPFRALGSVKSMIGHLMGAAGIASFIRTVLALSNKVLPPSLHCDEPLEALRSSEFFVNTEARPWTHPGTREPRRAGVNAFGFGGINVHVVLEEVPESNAGGVRSRRPFCPQSRPTELLAWSAANPLELALRVEGTLAAAAAIPGPSLAGLASATVADARHDDTCRLAVVAESIESLRGDLPAIVEGLRTGARPAGSADLEFAASPGPPGRVGMVFPGLGLRGPAGEAGGRFVDLALCFPELRHLLDGFDARDDLPDDPVPTSFLLAPPAGRPPEWRERLSRRMDLPDLAALRGDITPRAAVDRPLPVAAVVISNWIDWKVVEMLGVTVDCVCGQSLGELCAAAAAGVFPMADVAVGLWRSIGLPPYDGDGQLAVAFAAEGAIEPVLALVPGVSIAVHVAPEIHLLGGRVSSLETAIAQLAARGVFARLLPFPPLHTPPCDYLNDTVIRTVEAAWASVNEPRIPVYSSSGGAPSPRDRSDVPAMVSRLLNEPVRFWQAIRRMYDDGVRVFVEAGDAGLASTVGAAIPSHGAVVASIDEEDVHPLTQLHRFCGRLFAAGVTIDLSALHRQRARERAAPPPPAPLPVPSVRSMPLKLTSLPFGQEEYEKGLEAFGIRSDGTPVAPPPAAETAPDIRPATGRMPFVDRVVEHLPGERIVIERILDLDRDLMLHDHAFILVKDRKPIEACMPVLPAAGAVEVLAEAARALLPDLGVIGVEGMRATRWIDLLDTRSLPLRIEARVDSRDAATGVVSVRAEIFVDGEARAAAVVRMGSAYEQTLEPAFTPRDGARPWLDTAEGIYRDRRMHHGPRLQTLVETGATGATGCDGALVVLPVDDWFVDDPAPTMILDVGVLDGVAQFVSCRALCYGRVTVPLGFARLELYRGTPSVGTRCSVRAELIEGDERSRTFVFDVEVGDGAGGVWFRIARFTLWAFDLAPRVWETLRSPEQGFLSDRRRFPFLPEDTVVRRIAPSDLQGINQDWISRACLSSRERGEQAAYGDYRRRKQWLFGRLAAKDAVRTWLRDRHGVAFVHPLDFEVLADERGRPVVHPVASLPAVPSVSIAHSGTTATAMVSALPCGIDEEPLERDTSAIAADFSTAAEREMVVGIPGNPQLTLWCAKEAVAKALGSGLGGRPGDFVAVAAGADGRFVVRHLPSGAEHAVATAEDHGSIVAWTPALPAEPASPRSVAEERVPAKIAIVGAGSMGRGIARLAVARGIAVTLADSDAETLEKGRQAILGGYPHAIVSVFSDPTAAVAGADVVIEAITEEEEAKRVLLARLEPRLEPHAFLATNTSSIPVAVLAGDLDRPERFCGVHFFNPVVPGGIVEIVRGVATSPRTAAKAEALVRALGCRPLAVGDGPGFLVNRINHPLMREVLEVLSEGATPRQIDDAMKAVGWLRGPTELYDIVGIDVALRAGRNLSVAFFGPTDAPMILVRLMAAGRLGVKTGRGFYAWDHPAAYAIEGLAGDGQSVPRDDPEAEELLRACRRGDHVFSAAEIQTRLRLVALLEATRVLDEAIVEDPRDIDLAFAGSGAFRSTSDGLLAWADMFGAAAIVEMLGRFAHLGSRMQPTGRLLRMAARGETFLDPIPKS